MHHIPRRALSGISLVLLPALASAQCQEWASGFHLDGIDGSVSVLAVADLGSGPELYAGGTFQLAGTVPVSNIARWDGTSWRPLGAGTNGNVQAITTWDDGTGVKLYVGGSFVQAGGLNTGEVARWDGSAWSALNVAQTPNNGGVLDLEVFDDGNGPKLYACGNFTVVTGTVNSRRISRFDGTNWSAVGFGANGTIEALAVFDDGTGSKLYATGAFTSVGTNFNGDTAASAIARWSGTSWETSFGGLQSGGLTLATLDDGTGPALYVGGYFNAAGGQSADRAAKYSSSGWSAVGFGLNSAPLDFEVFDDGTGPALYACGYFSNAGSFAKYIPGLNWVAVAGGTSGTETMAVFPNAGQPALWLGAGTSSAGDVGSHGVMVWDGASYSLINPADGIDVIANQTVVHDDGSGPALFMSGSNWYGVGGLKAPNGSTAKWDGTAWSIVGTPGVGGVLVSVPSGPLAGLYAFSAISAYSPTGFARWDGTAWTFIDSSVITSHSFSAAGYGVDANGPMLMATAGNNTYRWDGSVWAIAPGLGQSVYCCVELDDGTGPAMYASTDNMGIYKWDSTWWNRVSTGTTGDVREMLVFDDGSGPAMYVRGSMQFGGLKYFAKFVNGMFIEVPGSTTFGLDDFCVFDDGTGPAIHGITNFNTFPGTASRDYRWTPAGWVPASTTVNMHAFRMQPMVDAGGNGAHLFLFGDFDAADGAPSHNIARWDVCPGTGVNFCFGDGSASACPCANESTPGEQRGCLNSLGSGGRLAATGVASLANDTVVLTGSGMPNSSALYFQGTQQQSSGAGGPFGDGLRCAGGMIVRLGTKTNAAGISQFPASGDPLVSVRGLVTTPGVRTYQVWYRNAATFCTVSTFNLTNGTQVSWTL